jgi:hypothetical protein
MAHTILHEVGDFTDAPRRSIPVQRWSLLLAVALGGSLLYGGSLGLVLPGWHLSRAALWLTLSAGLAWCVFIPSLWLAFRLPLWRCFDACLITIAAGEVVLVSGALVNGLLWRDGLLAHAALINALVVGISNIAMAVMLVLQLRARGIGVVRTLALWMLVLNGSGAVFFAALHRWLHGA